MSIEVMALVWRADLPAMDKIVLLRLADFADAYGRNVYPSVERVQKECGASERHVRGAIKKFTTDGLLVLVRQGGGRNRPAEYRFDLEALKRCTPCRVLDLSEPENPAPGAPIEDQKGAGGAGNPAHGAENPAPGAPNPSVTTSNRQSDIPPSSPAIDQPSLFGHDLGRADAPASGHDTDEPSVDELFEEWWAQVPRKASKGTARKSFATALKRTDFVTLKAGIMRYSAECVGRDPRYIKHPATWLNGQCWLDDPAPTPANGGPHGERPHHGSRDRDAGYSAHEALFAGGAAVAARYRKPNDH